MTAVTPTHDSIPSLGRAAGRKLREVLLTATVALIAVMPFLFSPRVPQGTEDQHWVSVTDWGPIHLTTNTDSPGFDSLARDPRLVLKPNEVRQSRPLTGVLGWLMSAPFRLPVLQALGLQTASYFPEYAGFVTLNLLLLVMTAMILRRLLGAESLSETRMFFPLTVLLVNPVTKAFFWTPHVQIFTGLIGVGSILLVTWLRRDANADRWRSLAVTGLSLGVLSLAYGAFAVPAAAAVLCVVFRAGPSELRSQLPKNVARSIILLGAFFLPVVGWILFVTAHTGSFYSHETGFYREFVWLADALRRGPLSNTHCLYCSQRLSHEIALRARDYGRTLFKVAAFPVVVLIALLCIRLRLPVGTRSGPRWHKDVGFAIWCFLAADVPFFFLLGRYWERLSWGIVPAIVVAIGLTTASVESALSSQGRQMLRAGLAVVSLCYALFWITTAGPWS